MPRLFHKKLGREVTVPAGAAKVLAASGWVPVDDTPPAPAPEAESDDVKPRRRSEKPD